MAAFVNCILQNSCPLNPIHLEHQLWSKQTLIDWQFGASAMETSVELWLVELHIQERKESCKRRKKTRF